MKTITLKAAEHKLILETIQSQIKIYEGSVKWEKWAFTKPQLKKFKKKISALKKLQRVIA